MIAGAGGGRLEREPGSATSDRAPPFSRLHPENMALR
jgi:hypothetical protein